MPLHPLHNNKRDAQAVKDAFRRAMDKYYEERFNIFDFDKFYEEDKSISNADNAIIDGKTTASAKKAVGADGK